MSDSLDAVASFTAQPRTFMRSNIIDVGSVDISDVTNLTFRPHQEICDLGRRACCAWG